MNKNILKSAGVNALATGLYIVVIALFLSSTARIFGPSNTMLIPIAMLLLFVFSATFTGVLVLGKPILWYLDGKKKEAVSLFMATLGFLFVLTVGAFLALMVHGL